MFSFRLSEEFLNQYKERAVQWGYQDSAGNSVGEITFVRTYSRVKPDGTKERWWEVCQRVIEGMFSIQKDWCSTNRLPWNHNKGQKAAQDAYDRLFHFKWTPPGRGLWMMGTPIVMDQRNSAALQNCAFVSTSDMSKNDPAEPFCFLMEASMLGVGVGFDTQGTHRGFTISRPSDSANMYMVSDTREGWVESVRLLLNSYLISGSPQWRYDYSLIRPAGSPIKTFGGTAAGPEPLQRLHDKLHHLLSDRIDQELSSRDIADIGNLIGVCVVSGNVRRSAELLIGSIDDKDFLNLKNKEIFPERNSYDPDNPGWGWMSNNTVQVEVGDDLSPVIEGIERNGEPGIMWIDTTRQFGRLLDAPDNKDWRVTGVNPCLTEEAWIQTVEGPRQVRDLISREFTAIVDGKPYDSIGKGFWMTATDAEVFDLQTDEGWTVRLTSNHEVKTVQRGWIEAGQLVPGEEIVLQDQAGASWSGRGNEEEGYLMGHLWGDGTLVGSRAVLSVWGNRHSELRSYIERAASKFPHRADWQGFKSVDRAGEEWRLSSSALGSLARSYGIVHGSKKISDELEKSSSAFYKGFIRAAFDTDGHVEGSATGAGVSIRLSQSDRDQLVRVQRMLGRLGIHSVIRSGRPSIIREMPGGSYQCAASWRLILTGSRAAHYMAEIGFADPEKYAKWQTLISEMSRGFYSKPAVARFEELVPAGRATVYDVSIESVRSFDANGLTVHNCGEQPLESYECCTLVDSFLGRHENLDDYRRTLKVAYLYAKTVTLLTTHWPKTNAIMQRNRRIGTSASGQANFADNRGLPELKKWLMAGYETVRNYDRVYSEWLGVRESIKVTTVKPSGTVAILAGESPGVHWAPGGEYFFRIIQFSNTDPLLEEFSKAGYRVEVSAESPETTSVIYFPVRSSAARSEQDVTLFEKANLAVMAQRYWSDNAVSVTLSFNQLTEARHVPTVLHMHEGSLKTVSFLPMGGKVYPQMPFTSIQVDEYEAACQKLSKVDMSSLYDGGKVQDGVGEAYCTTDRCEVPIATQ